MKKLMTILSATATLFAFCAVNGDDVLPHGADFEANGYVAGENFTNYVNKAEDGVATSGNRYWYSTSEDIGVISNHQSGISVKSVPDLYEHATPTGGVKYLQLDTQAPLFRTIKDNGQRADFTGVDMSTGDGIYLDTLVKFTAADAAFGTNALEEAVDKIAIEYVEREIEYGTGDEATVVKVTPLTNFVVCAGFIGSAFATNYVVDVPDGWLENNMKDDWHRLTVRALTNIDGNNRAGFKIYLDEVPLVYRTDKDEFAQSAGFEDDTHMIFPSAVATGDNKTTISAVAFSGNGSIDDVVFTTTKPKFIAESEAVVVPFVADAGVTAISVEVDDNEVTNIAVTAAGTYAATLEAQTANFTVNVRVDEANGYTLGGISYNGDPVVNGEVTGYTGGDITITTIRNNFNLFDADGNAITTGAPFQKLSEVLETEGVAKIVLAHNYDVAESEGDGFVTYDIDNDITLDLNGNTITGGGDDALFTVGDSVTMVVIDSSAANTGKIDYTGTYAVFYSEGDVVIGALTGDYGPSIDGYLAAAEDQADGVWLVRAKIDAANNSDEGEFLWDGYLGDPDGTITSDADLDSDEEYWVVEPQNTPQPTTYEVTWTLSGGTASATSGDDFEENDTIVFTADTGKTLSYVEIDGVEDTSAYGETSYTYTVGTADAELVVTFTTSATPTYAISWTLTGGTTTATAGDFEENATIVFTADTGKTLSFVSIDGTEIADTSVYGASSYTYTVGPAAATLVVTFTGSSYPTYIDPTDAEETAKYTNWATYAGVDVATAELNEDAYLLNCLVSEVTAAKAAFKFTAFDQANPKDTTKTTTTTSYNGRDYNGTVVIKQYSDVGCTTESATGTFFRAVLQ